MKAGRGRPKNKGTHAGSGRGNVKHKKNADPSSPLLCEPLSEPANVTRSTRGRPKKKGTNAGSGRGGRPKKKGTHAGSGRGNIKHKKMMILPVHYCANLYLNLLMLPVLLAII